VFERYTENARRALFFARHETSRLGGTAIETEHLLLGLMRDADAVVAKIFAPLPLESIRRELEKGSLFREKTPTSVELPFSRETKRVLNFAAEEADRLLHHSIGPEHLLLALLREEKSPAAVILTTHGLRLDDVRLQIVKLLRETETSAWGPTQTEQIDKIKKWVELLGQTPRDSDEARELIDGIAAELNDLKRYVNE
jgi:ATP-dependent Clp protease ATP-binding subunit ClpC